MVYFAAALPFLLSGMIVSLAIAETHESRRSRLLLRPRRRRRSCALVIPLLNIVGGPGALSAAVLFAAAAAVWFWPGAGDHRPGLGVALALFLVALIIVNKRKPILDISSAKAANSRPNSSSGTASPASRSARCEGPEPPRGH
ncbi:MAG: hypothetical protein QM757_41330 [Paludibaculum sp.]